jgi:hypothetical protein
MATSETMPATVATSRHSDPVVGTPTLRRFRRTVSASASVSSLAITVAAATATRLVKKTITPWSTPRRRAMRPAA